MFSDFKIQFYVSWPARLGLRALKNLVNIIRYYE